MHRRSASLLCTRREMEAQAQSGCAVSNLYPLSKQLPPQTGGALCCPSTPRGCACFHACCAISLQQTILSFLRRHKSDTATSKFTCSNLEQLYEAKEDPQAGSVLSPSRVRFRFAAKCKKAIAKQLDRAAYLYCGVVLINKMVLNELYCQSALPNASSSHYYQLVLGHLPADPSSGRPGAPPPAGRNTATTLGE